MYFRKIILWAVAMAIGISVIILAATKGNQALETATQPARRQLVIIDAGHGGLTNTIN